MTELRLILQNCNTNVGRDTSKSLKICWCINGLTKIETAYHFSCSSVALIAAKLLLETWTRNRNLGSWFHLSHWILLILVYQHIINTNNWQCNDLDFKHCKLDIVDRMQIRIQQLRSKLAFKQHINLSLIEIDSVLSSVSIGPLYYLLDYISTAILD